MFSAAHTHTNGKLYFFDQGHYFRFDLEKGVVDPDYPRLIVDNWSGAPTDIDATVQGTGASAHKLYMFKGAQYWRYDMNRSQVDTGYPKMIADVWTGLFPSGIDAAFINPVNGKHYFFKGTQYIRYDFDTGADAGYPKSISSHWPGLSGPFDCVLMGTGTRENKAYFFKDSEYWRYDLRAARTDSGYPKSTAPLWPGLALSSAEADIVAFEGRTGASKWPNIDRATIARELRQTIATPTLVSQGQTPMCGPAAICYALAKRRPRDYVRLVTDLFEIGTHKMKTKTIKPSGAVKQSSPRDNVRQIDWLSMVAMRDSANAIFDIDGNEGQLAQNIQEGVTTPWEMKSWCTELLRLRNCKYESCYFFGEETALKNADTRHKNGGVAFLMIDSAMAKNQSASVAIPNHWVVYEGGLDIERRSFWKGDKYKFKIWTWGEASFRSVAQGESHFEDNMWGAVYGDA